VAARIAEAEVITKMQSWTAPYPERQPGGPRAWIETDAGDQLVIYDRAGALTGFDLVHVLTGAMPDSMIRLLQLLPIPEGRRVVSPPDWGGDRVRIVANVVVGEYAAMGRAVSGVRPAVPPIPHEDQLGPGELPRELPTEPTWTYQAFES
jgi:hypothetical protein